MAVRDNILREALRSFRDLQSHMPVMTEEEVDAALRLEYETMRRRTILDRLISRKVSMATERFRQELHARYE